MNKDNLLTIMTPTYNRAKMLPSLYESLCNQTSNNFIWLIVDDGSIDNTKEVVNSFIKDQKIQIEYYYEVNAGKYVAHNKGVEVCSTELFVCVDSDDILLPQAVEKIENTWKSVKDNYVGGIVSPKEMDGYSYFNNPPKTCKLMDLYNSKYLVGETVLVYKSSLLKEHLFPVIPGEKFMSESVLYNILDQKCKLVILNDYIYKAEYQEDGLTRNIQKIHWKNPRSTLLMYKSNAAYDTRFINAAKSYGCYLAWKKIRKLPDCIENWKVSRIVQFVGVMFLPHYIKLFKEQSMEFNY